MLSMIQIANHVAGLFNGDLHTMWVKQTACSNHIHFTVIDLFDKEWVYSVVMEQNGSMCDLVPLECIEDAHNRMDGDEVKVIVSVECCADGQELRVWVE